MAAHTSGVWRPFAHDISHRRVSLVIRRVALAMIVGIFPDHRFEDFVLIHRNDGTTIQVVFLTNILADNLDDMLGGAVLVLPVGIEDLGYHAFLKETGQGGNSLCLCVEIGLQRLVVGRHSVAAAQCLIDVRRCLIAWSAFVVFMLHKAPISRVA